MRKLNDKPRSRRTPPAKPSREELEAALSERERELAEARRQQTATADVLKVISRSAFNLQAVFDALLSSAVTLCGAAGGAIWTREGDVLRHRADFGVSPEFVRYVRDNPQRPSRETVAGRVFLSGRIEQVPDTLADKDYSPPAYGMTSARSVLGAPLLRDERVEGVIILLKREPEPFSERQIELVQTFADQAVIAIQNTRLFNETEEALERQTATAEVLKVIARSPSDTQPVFDAIAESAKRLLGGYSAVVTLSVGDWTHLAAFTPVDPAADAALKATYPVPRAFFSKIEEVVTRQGFAEAADTESDWDGAFRDLGRARGYRSLVVVPLLVGAEPIGAIAVARKETGRFAPHHIELLQTFADQAVIAIENARLFNETQDALERQTATSEILKVIAASPSDAAPVFEAIAHSAKRLLGGFSTTVFRFDGEIAHLAAFTPTNPEADAALQALSPIRVDEFAAAPLREGESVQVPDTEEAPQPLRDIARLRGYRAMLYVPLTQRGSAVGFVSVTRKEPGPFDPDDVALLKTFADQAVIAIENARLFGEVQARTRDLEEALAQQTATAEVLKVISRSSFDLNLAAPTILETAATLCRASMATLHLRDGDVCRLTTQFGLPEAFEREAGENPIPVRYPLHSRRTAQAGDVAHYSDAWTDPDYLYKSSARLGGYRAIVVIPLMREGELVGIFSLGRPAPEPFSESQIKLTQTFADQAAIAIENARLFNEVQAKTRDLSEALQQQTATAEVLKVISRSTFDLNAVLTILVQSARDLCNAPQCMLFLRENGLYCCAMQVGWPPEVEQYFRDNPIPPGPYSGAGRAAITGQVVHFPDVLADPDYRLPEHQSRALYRTLLSVPLLREEDVIGVFSLGRPNPDPFTEREIELVKTFADQAVIAIENVRLFDEVQAKTRDLEESLAQQTATADVLKVISRSAFDLQTVLDTLITSAVKMIGAAAGVIALRDGEGLSYRATYGMPEEYKRWLLQTPFRAGRATSLGRVLLTGEINIIPDLLEDKEYAGPAHRLTGTRSILTVPLIRDGRLEVAFSLNRLEPGDFTPRQIELVRTFADQALIAIENVRLFDEVQARTRDLSESLQQQTATADVLKVISRSAFDLRAVLTTLAESARELCAASFTMVFMRDGDLMRFQAHSGCSPEWIEYLRAHPIRAGRATNTGLATLTGEVVHRPDVLADPEYDYGRGPEVGTYRAMLSVPLLRDGRVEGVFNLARPEPGPFEPRQIELVRAFADQAVIAIQNTRLFDEVQAKTRDLEESLQQQTATADVLKVISRSAFDLDSVLGTLVESARRLCDAPQGMILMRDGAALRISKQIGFPTEFERYLLDTPLPIDNRAGATRAALTGEVAHIPDVLQDPDYGLTEGIRLGGYRAILSVPLLREKEAIGVFSLGRPIPNPFTQRQIELVRTFADQAVIAIENARLFDEVQAKTRDLEEALQQQTATANVLQVISRSAFDLQTVLTTLAESARQLCAASFVTLSLRDGEVMRLRAESGCTPEIVAFMHAHPIRAGRKTFTGRVMLSGEAVHLPDVLADPEYEFGEGPRIGNYRALLAVPLLREGRVEGVFALARPEPEPFTERQIEMVRAFADQAVIAIENARLFDEVEARTRELTASLDDLRKAQDRLIQSEKLASLGQLTAGIAHEIKNPLNFVNNFSGLSREMLGELGDIVAKAPLDARGREEADELMTTIAANLDKVVQHGKRADSIVKNMLLHSRSGSGERASVNVNALVEEALNLAYHGARAEKPGFNVTIEKSLDPNAGAAELYSQEVTRVLLNLISNGFYATTKRKREGTNPEYEPMLAAMTRDRGDKVEIVIRDNGTGIPDEVKAKMFNPFFTTKPAGEGTGLGLSLSHDIVVKQHSGTIEVATEPNAYTEFKIRLPRGAPSPRSRGEG